MSFTNLKLRGGPTGGPSRSSMVGVPVQSSDVELFAVDQKRRRCARVLGGLDLVLVWLVHTSDEPCKDVADVTARQGIVSAGPGRWPTDCQPPCRQPVTPPGPGSARAPARP